MNRENKNSDKEEMASSNPDWEIFTKWFDSYNDSTGFFDSLTSAQKEVHRNKLFNKTKQNLPLDEHDGSSVHQGASLIYRLMDHSLAKVAATLVVGLILSLATFYGIQKEGFTPSIQVSTLTEVNQVGEVSKLKLPDGTMVWLGAASSLTYPKAFSDSLRYIELDGEAYFEVTHNEKSPFVVKSGTVRTRVLGTKFNVKAYDEDMDVAVTLASGKVAVLSSSRENPTILSPNEQFLINKKSGMGEVRPVNASLVNAWKNKELVFIRESFARIAKTFERWYGVEFIFKDSSLEEEIFVYHFKEFSLSHSLDILSELANFNYKINDDKVTISQH